MARQASKSTQRKPNKKTLPKTNNATSNRVNESYTSLILGIIAIIIGTVLLLSFAHNKNTVKPNNPNNVKYFTKINQKPTNITQNSKNLKKSSTTTITPAPTLTSIPTPTKITSNVPTVSPTHTLQPTQAPNNFINSGNRGNTYTVKPGDNLWSIAQNRYGSGYNWVDIARANNLSTPDLINTGDKLILPEVAQKNATSEPANPTIATQNNAPTLGEKITGSAYTVVSGDSLWGIAVRAYGDGYQWVKIEKANNLSNPGLIFSGNKLTIPRK